VIECLKMACTGTLPPTCSQGQSFVNDPGMTNTTEVKAHIKMRFNNQAGYPTVVARSFQVTKKKAQIQFKSLDGLILISRSVSLSLTESRNNSIN
jgi:DNA repair protein RAD50